MMVKAAIIAATAAGSLLAVSPLAFAGDYPGGSDKSHHKSHDGNHKKKDDHKKKDCKCDKDHDKDWKGDHGNWGGPGGWGDGGGHGGRGGDWDRDRGGHGGGSYQNTSAVNGGHGGGGLINLSGNSVQVPVQLSNNNILHNIGLGILGRGSADSH